jgi:hypothetical protein
MSLSWNVCPVMQISIFQTVRLPFGSGIRVWERPCLVRNARALCDLRVIRAGVDGLVQLLTAQADSDVLHGPVKHR